MARPLSAEGGYLAIEWLDHYLQRLWTTYVLRRDVPVQIGKIRTGLLWASSSKISFGNLKKTVDGTESPQRKHSEKICFLVWAEPHTKLSGRFQVLRVGPLGMVVNNLPAIYHLFPRLIVPA